MVSHAGPKQLARLALLGVFGGLIACGEEEPAAREVEDVRIVAHEIGYRQEDRRIEVVGSARARQSAIIYPETSGEVTRVAFEAGDYVEQGDTLAELDSEEEQLAVRLARVAVAQAEQLLERYERIEGTGAVSAAQIDQARTALDSARIELEQAQLALRKRTIRAPFSGHVGLTDIDAGVRITTTTVITRLDDRSVLTVDFAVPEEIYAQISMSDTVEARPFSGPDRSIEAEIRAIDSQIDPVQRTFAVRAAIPNTDDRLRPGMSFRVGFSIPGQSYPAIPEAAILWGGEGSYVWAVRDGQAHRVPVTIVSREQGYVLVRGELEEGSLIVDQGVQKVREGTPVTPVSDAGSPRLNATGEASP